MAGDMVTAVIAIVAVLISVGGIVFGAGRQTSKIEAQSDRIGVLEREVLRLRSQSGEDTDDAREATAIVREELREFFGTVKEFTREQAAVNLQITKTLDSVARRLESVGDLVMEHKATIAIHGEVLRRKGLIAGE